MFPYLFPLASPSLPPFLSHPSRWSQSTKLISLKPAGHSGPPWAFSLHWPTALIYYKRKLLGHACFFRSPYCFPTFQKHPPSLISMPICVEADTDSGAAFQTLINRGLAYI